MKRYEALATDIEDSIRTGVLRAGDRLASVRHTSASRGVSPSTVFQAYYLLEARGLVQARERSGYFVAPGMGQRAPEPDLPSQPHEGSVAVDVSERVFEILESSRTREVVPFGSAFPSPMLFPLARLGQCMAAAAQSLDPWSTVDDLSPGHEPLRRQIALRYLAAGMPLHHDEIVVTNGALEALNLCLSVVTRPGDAVIVESPTFYAALQALERMGLHAIEVPTHPREGIDLAALEQAIVRHRPKACWLMTNFQNPLGSLVPEARKQALVALLARHQLPLIEDDVYGELYFGEKRPPPAKAFDQDGLVLHCSSFSKCLAPGWRIGWAAPGRFAKAVARAKLTTSLAVSAPTQRALASYLERGGYDKHLRKLRQTLATQQSRFAEVLAAQFPPGTRATRPEGGYFLWVELPPGTDALRLHRAALAEGISVAPGPIFSPSHGFGHCLRLNYGHAWDARSEQALATLGRLALACAAPARVHTLAPQAD
jgi:DNA-binding transcriptional MocR family regulator